MELAPYYALPLDRLTGFFAKHGLSPHQARLAFQAVHRYGEFDPDRMPAISASCKKFLGTLPPPPRLVLDTVHHAADGTIKLRLKAPEGALIESVIIPAARRVTLCVSSQVGCAAGCTFCHTGTMGLLRNLEVWEIVDQFRVANQVAMKELQGIDDRAQRTPVITNIVFMGMGEPLHNEANVMDACRILKENVGAGFSRRHLVLSTAGVGNRIRAVWETGVCSLAISLHATTNDVRNLIVPLNRQWNVEALREILLSIPWRGRESLTVAYLLLDGVNDSHADARGLAEWIKGLPAKINLLEFNPYPGSHFKRSPPERLAAFRQWLHDYGAFNTLRHSRGEDVLAACGQLATAGKTKLSGHGQRHK